MTIQTRFIALPSAARTASGSADIGQLPGDYDELIVYVDVTVVAGTSPSMTVTYQTSPNGVDYYDHSSGVAITAAGRQAIRVATCIGDYGRVAYAITGTTPSFTFSAIAEGKRRGT